MRKNSFLKRMLLNKILMAIVPILVLVCFLTESFFSLNTGQIEELQSRVLQENIKTFEDRYYDLQAMVLRFENESAVREANFNAGEISYTLLDFIRATALPRSFYTDFIFIPSVNGYIYTSSYTTNSKTDFATGGVRLSSRSRGTRRCWSTPRRGKRPFCPNS